MATEQLTKGLEKFGIQLFFELANANHQKNIIFSPFSIQTSIAMLRMAATGQTALEIDECFGSTSLNLDVVADFYHDLLLPYENSNILKIANKMYVMKNHEVNEKYNELLSEKFFSTADEIDFAASEQAADTMNTWVESKTNNLIKNAISPRMLNDTTGLVLLNAIHFKGKWEFQFPERATCQADFYLDNTTSVKVQMMRISTRFNYAELPDLDATALEMPYVDSDLSMLIILPNKRTGLSDLVEKLKNVSLQDLSKEMYYGKVNVIMPKFKAEFEMVLNEPLEKLGMSSMFSDSAELGKMLKSPDVLKVSKIVHKAYIEVNEAGTAAAAATTQYNGVLVSATIPELFNADHGFYYAIKSSNSIVLFEGKIEKF